MPRRERRIVTRHLQPLRHALIIHVSRPRQQLPQCYRIAQSEPRGALARMKEIRAQGGDHSDGEDARSPRRPLVRGYATDSVNSQHRLMATKRSKEPRMGNLRSVYTLGR